jgi:hypothetical protein
MAVKLDLCVFIRRLFLYFHQLLDDTLLLLSDVIDAKIVLHRSPAFGGVVT